MSTCPGRAPSVDAIDAMSRLLQNIQHELGQATSELAVGMFQRRLRTLYFEQEDKAAFVKNLLYTMPSSVASEETAAAVLNSAHHPSSDFPAVEMLDMVHRVMEVAGKSTGSPSFANSASCWLRRHFVRTEKTRAAPGDCSSAIKPKVSAVCPSAITWASGESPSRCSSSTSYLTNSSE